jgi:hypothetical protein
MVSLASDRLTLIKMAEDYDRLATDAARFGEQENYALLDSLPRLHRAASLHSSVLMRVAGERRVAIKESMALIERSIEALHLADVLLSRTPFVRGTVSPLE